MKLGVYQCPASGGVQDERLARLERHIAGQGLDLLLCPELFSTGYDQGADYGDLAEAPDGPFAQGIAALARKHGIAIADGYAERAGDMIYNSAPLKTGSGSRMRIMQGIVEGCRFMAVAGSWPLTGKTPPWRCRVRRV